MSRLEGILIRLETVNIAGIKCLLVWRVVREEATVTSQVSRIVTY